MDFAIIPDLRSRKRSDLLVLPFWKNGKNVESAADIGNLKAYADYPIVACDFSCAEVEVFIFYS